MAEMSGRAFKSIARKCLIYDESYGMYSGGICSRGRSISAMIV